MNLPNVFDCLNTSSPELVILGTVDEDVEGAVAGEEEVADSHHDAQAGDPSGGHGHFCKT